jgi:general stress protein 26
MSGDVEFVRRTFRDVPICRLATVGDDGAPHAAARWFVWLEDGLFVATRRGDASWRNVETNPRASVVVDRGRDWTDLAGVRVDGDAEAVAADGAALRPVMSAWHEKYRSQLAGEGFERMTRTVPDLGFLRVTAGSVTAWDHHTG